MRLVCLVVKRTGLQRFVGASSGTQPQGNRPVEAAMVAYRPEERTRLAHAMPPQELTMTREATCTGGLCLGGMAPALAGRNGTGMHATRDAAPGLRAEVAHHVGAQHAPDRFPGPHALRQAVSAPMATQPRAAAQAEATRKRVHEHLHNANEAPPPHGPGRPP